MPDAASLAQRQAQLLAALLSGVPLPDGFDAARARAVSTILRTKRRKAALHAVPTLPTVIGTDWPQAFDRFGAATIVTEQTTALDDAIAFLNWYGRHGGHRWAIRSLQLRLRWRRVVMRARRANHAVQTEGTL